MSRRFAIVAEFDTALCESDLGSARVLPGLLHVVARSDIYEKAVE